MSHKPYTYIMPEEFMKDQSVPATWRLLGVLNGFFFNHLDVYASNQWLAEQLGCSQRTISDAVAALETFGKIKCIRTRTSRVIKRGDSNQLLSPSQPTAIPDSNQLLSNADSNADRKLSAVAPIEVVQDKPKPDKGYSEVMKLFSSSKQGWMFHKAQIEAAKRLYLKPGVGKITRTLEFYRDHAGEKGCPDIHTPYDLEAKIGKLTAFKKRIGE